MEAEQDKAMDITPILASWQRACSANKHFTKANFNHSIFQTPTEGDSGFHSITPDSAESLPNLSSFKQCNAYNFLPQVKHPVNSTPVNSDLMDTSLYVEDEQMHDLFVSNENEQFNLNDDENMISNDEKSTNISIFFKKCHAKEDKSMSEILDDRYLINSTSCSNDCSISSPVQTSKFVPPVIQCTSMSVDDKSENSSPYQSTETALNSKKRELEHMVLQVSLLPEIVSPFNSHSLPVNDSKKRFLNGIERVDILYLLGMKDNFLNVVSNIFSYLDAYDLANVKKVSHRWSQILMNVQPAQNRWKKWRKQYREQKENLSESKKPLTSEKMSTRSVRQRLSTIENISLLQPSVTSHFPTSPAVSPSKRKFHQFQKEGQKLKEGERLLRCPKCTYPSLDPGTTYATCTRIGCKFEFCIFCCGNYSTNHNCPPLYTPRPCKRSLTIGSKGSRRNLRRL